MKHTTNERGSAVISVLAVMIVVAVTGGIVLTTLGTPNGEPRAIESAESTPGATAGTEAETPVATSAVAERTDADQETATAPAEVAAVDTATTTTGAVGTFEEFAPEKLARATSGTVVLFFHADWCPSCRALEADISENQSDIPADTHILKVDYDTATELKERYGVVRQHTLVQVDETGEKIQTLTGLTNTLEQVVTQI